MHMLSTTVTSQVTFKDTEHFFGIILLHSANYNLVFIEVLLTCLTLPNDARYVELSMYASLTVKYWSYKSFHISFRFSRSVPAFTEFIDPVFAKNKPKTGSINSPTAGDVVFWRTSIFFNSREQVFL
jgi:hypothetical protein